VLVRGGAEHHVQVILWESPQSRESRRVACAWGTTDILSELEKKICNLSLFAIDRGMKNFPTKVLPRSEIILVINPRHSTDLQQGAASLLPHATAGRLLA
jgi:hypothetical protein